MFEPGAPQSVTLTSVGAHTAVVTWTAPNITGTVVSAYYVQLRRGNENAAWVTVVSRGSKLDGMQTILSSEIVKHQRVRLRC